MDNIKDTLQAKYCPPLDTSLLAALISDLEAEHITQKKKAPSPQQIFEFEQQLSALAALAEQQNVDHEESMFSDYTPLDLVSLSFSNSTEDPPDWSSGDITVASRSEASSIASNLNSPLEFLQVTFPHMDVTRLRGVLARSSDNEIDMEAIVDELLTNEYLLEVEERDLDGDITSTELTNPWVSVEREKRKVPNSTPVRVIQTAKKNVTRPTKIAITDVRQRQTHLHSTRLQSKPRPPPAPDPWSQTMSLATHLSSLLPSQPISYFQSAFHSPQHSSPAMAFRSCLVTIANTQGPIIDDNQSNAEKTQLFQLFDILHSSPTYFQLDAEQKDQVLSDATLALRATRNNPDIALEIVEILFDLDTELDVGIYHSPVTYTPESPTTKSPLYRNEETSSLSPISMPKFSSHRTSAKTEPCAFEWQCVPERKIVQEQNFLAEAIPAYKSTIKKTGVKGSGNGIGKGGKGDVGELNHLEKMARMRKNRQEALQEATRYWKKGTVGNRGGEVAMYFAERARNIQTQAEQEALEVARDMVISKRVSSDTGDSIDLHGTTVSEAVTIVEDFLSEHPSSNLKPLKIITGRGKHSAGKVSVLKPAVKNALVKGGWDVGTFDSGLLVRGRR